MRALGIIAGFVAGLSTAHAAEGDDLVSVFQAVCMTPGPFSDSARDFAKKHGWNIRTTPNGEVQTISSKKRVKTGKSGLFEEQPAFFVSFSFGPSDHATSVHGLSVEACWVSEPGLRRSVSEKKLLNRADLPQPRRPVSPEVRRWFGYEGPGDQALEWSLPGEPWDYVVLDESLHRRANTYLVRLRPFKGKTP